LKIIIGPKRVKNLKAWFSSYVKTFKFGDKELRQNVILKEEHTKRVCNEILRIGEQIELNQDEMCLAEIMALLHDVGRFEQYAHYRTFHDRKSEDHAILGINILNRYGILNGFEEATKDLILRVIGYHNRATLPSSEPEPGMLFTKLLRDADKLDIWKVVTDYYHRGNGQRNGALELDLPNTPGISTEVYRDLINQGVVDVNTIRNLNDFKLLQIGWVFDINFEPSLRSVRSRRYLEMILETLPESDEIHGIYNVTQKYIDHRLNGMREKQL